MIVIAQKCKQKKTSRNPYIKRCLFGSMLNLCRYSPILFGMNPNNFVTSKYLLACNRSTLTKNIKYIYKKVALNLSYFRYHVIFVSFNHIHVRTTKKGKV